MPKVTETGNTSHLGHKTAPNTATHYDFMGASDPKSEYYRLKLNQLKLEANKHALTDAEQKALQLNSDLDLLETKTLAKLKVKSDMEMAPLRAVSGHESREDIARWMAERYFNKKTVDEVVNGVMNETKAFGILDAANKVIREPLGSEAGFGDAPTGSWGAIAAATSRFGLS